MMYWLAKIFQAAGLTILGVGFLNAFPHLVSHNIFLVAIAFFTAGWLIQQFFLK